MKRAEILAEQTRLLALANTLAWRHWGVEYTGALRLTNRNWTRMEACYAWCADLADMSVQEIRMSVPVNTRIGEVRAEGNLLHELVHWRLHTTGQPFDDVDDTFIAECLRVGAPLSMGRREQAAYRLYRMKNGLIEEAA